MLVLRCPECAVFSDELPEDDEAINDAVHAFLEAHFDHLQAGDEIAVLPPAVAEALNRLRLLFGPK